MPVKLFDYMAAGLATIGSMGGEAAELLDAGAGRRYRAGSAESLIETINFFVEHPAELEASRRYAYERSGRFDQSAQHERFALLIEKLLGETQSC
jgi:glycosyltransferase involved in cell wall biosynthesis